MAPKKKIETQEEVIVPVTEPAPEAPKFDPTLPESKQRWLR